VLDAQAVTGLVQDAVEVLIFLGRAPAELRVGGAIDRRGGIAAEEGPVEIRVIREHEHAGELREVDIVVGRGRADIDLVGAVHDVELGGRGVGRIPSLHHRAREVEVAVGDVPPVVEYAVQPRARFGEHLLVVIDCVRLVGLIGELAKDDHQRLLAGERPCPAGHDRRHDHHTQHRE
jgi:hypothetical protein